MLRVSRRVAVRTAVLALLGAGILVVIGTYHRFAWDIYELCQVKGQRYDPATASAGTVFPISQRCNADYDLVPGWINPSLVVLLVLAVIMAIVAVTAPPPGTNAPADPQDGPHP